MKPVPRIVAICEGGPLDGARFSVALIDDQAPAISFLNGDSSVTYNPDLELNLKDEHTSSLEAQRRGDEKSPVFDGFDLHDPDEAGFVRGHQFTGVFLYKEEAK